MLSYQTLNEEMNLKFLINNFISTFNNYGLQNYEILIIDDGSEDGTENYVKKLIKRITE